jgi:hypothetical protein
MEPRNTILIGSGVEVRIVLALKSIPEPLAKVKVMLSSTAYVAGVDVIEALEFSTPVKEPTAPIPGDTKGVFSVEAVQPPSDPGEGVVFVGSTQLW